MIKMITYKNDINNFYELYDLAWGGAIDRLDEIIDLGLQHEFMVYLEEMLSCDEDLTLTDINDFIWFECDDWIDEHKEEE